MFIGIPYAEAIQLPLHIAMAFLSDGRQNNTHQDLKKNNVGKQGQSVQQPLSNTVTKSYVSTERRHSKHKGKT